MTIIIILIFVSNFTIDFMNSNVQKQREFLDKVAEDKGFDPINEPHMWMYVKRRDVWKYKVHSHSHTLSH